MFALLFIIHCPSGLLRDTTEICTFNNDQWSSTETREDMERLLCFTLLSRLSPTKWMGEGGRNKQINARPYLPFFFSFNLYPPIYPGPRREESGEGGRSAANQMSQQNYIYHQEAATRRSAHFSPASTTRSNQRIHHTPKG